MARKRHLFLHQLLTVLRVANLKIRWVILQPKFLKRWVVYGSMACLSTLLFVVGLPAIAFSTSEFITKGSIPNITATQIPSTSSYSLQATHEQIPPLKRGGRENRTQAESSEQQAKNLYEAGQFSEASQLLEKALQGYQNNGDTIGQAVVLSNLALTYQQLGTWEKANQAIAQAFTLLKQAPQDTPSRLAVWAQALDVLGNLQLAQGNADKANETWEKSARLYTQLRDSTRATRSRINQAQALQALGLYSQARLMLKDLQEDLQSQQPNAPSLAKAENLRILGDALRATGNLDCPSEQLQRSQGKKDKSQQSPNCVAARELLQESLNIATQLRSPQAIAAANLSLGNVAWAESQVTRERGTDDQANRQEADRKLEEAFRFYQQAITESVAPIQTQAQLNLLRLLVERQQWSEAEKLYPNLQKQIANLPPGRSKIYAQVNLAISLRKLSTRNQENGMFTTPGAQEINQVLTVARREAERLGDVRSQAHVLQELGQLYEKTQQWSFAQDLAQQSLNLSHSINASEISYRAAWELGRIFKAQNKPEDAIAAYTEAYEALKSVRGDLIAASADVQFSFRRSVEPVYRELVDLLLQPSPGETALTQGKQESLKQSQETQKNRKQKKLKKAREVLEALQVAQLQNYLRQACEDVTLELDKLVDREAQNGHKAAIIYPIILSDRLEVILKLPNQEELYQYPPVRLSRNDIQKTIDQFQNNLRDEHRFKAVRANGQAIYKWLIEPVSEQLESSGIKTLIFILDSSLRTIPMSALFDGQQFLVEKYSISLVLGLQVRDPVPLNRANLNVLAASLTEPPKGFEQYGKLPNVNPELDEIKKAGVSVSTLRDNNFTSTEFNKELNQQSFEVVHLATHGQFGADRNSTYILTADGAIYVDELGDLFRNLRGTQAKATDLLILSACKTAAGNDRAVLGIAGTTVRAGARSAIAGLWSLADNSSAKFTQTFYQYLGRPGITRAEALRQAQLALLQDRSFSHPRYWAPYVLVGSWL